MGIKVDGIVKVIADRRITLPKEVRDHWALSEGDLLSYVFSDEGLLIKPLQLSEKKINKLRK